MQSETYKLSDFTIIRKLGEGGFGSAFLARRNSDGIELCLKEIPLYSGISEQQIEREANNLSKFHSRHIVQYYGSFTDSGNFYLIMEYAKEGSLDKMIDVCFISLYIVLMFLYLCLRRVDN